MSLFANERDANLQSTVALIEDILIEFGHVVQEVRCDTPAGASVARAWNITSGSASVRIELIEQAAHHRLRVSSVVMTIDDGVDTHALFRNLLVLNAKQVTGAAFALSDQQVVLLTERSTLDLDRSEMHDLISRVRTFADEYDDILVNQYGGQMGAGTGGPS